MSQRTSNYSDSKYSTLSHQVPNDLADRRALTAQEYINNERSKQLVQLRNWHLHASNCGRSSASLRTNFSSTRALVDESNPVFDARIAAVVLLLILSGIFYLYFST